MNTFTITFGLKYASFPVRTLLKTEVSEKKLKTQIHESLESGNDWIVCGEFIIKRSHIIYCEILQEE